MIEQALREELSQHLAACPSELSAERRGYRYGHYPPAVADSLCGAARLGGAACPGRRGGVPDAFPPELWKRIRTTNLLQRTFREYRRRTRPMQVFPSPESAERNYYGVTDYLNRNWEEHGQ